MYLRLLLGFVLVVLSILHVDGFKIFAVAIISAGLLSDIFDGIIARRLNISTEKLRRLDSSIDQVFWCLVAIAAFIEHPAFFYDNYLKLIFLIGAEALTYVLSFAKFRKEVATHAIASKIWTLILFAALIEILWTGTSGLIFDFCFYVGLVTRLEIIAILVLLRSWTNDVPTVYHAVRLRQGKPIKRHKLFNG
ncbi:MAG: CDP-alcohol phosphatidyltransferase [Sphingobacteriaceae bacterium]|nr:CDP-alcohol phosphatidyltransferase [Sphingobacteriaceae bacterium]